jgi:transcriptional regulator with XRE-family HTH domain
MTRRRTEYEVFESASDQNRRLLRQEELILEVTEALSSAIQRENITRTALAARLGRTKGFVSQVLGGGRNLTLRTIADIADAVGYEIRIQVAKRGVQQDVDESSTQRPSVAWGQEVQWTRRQPVSLKVTTREFKQSVVATSEEDTVAA